jgi:NAD(P)-dependent dehydrogenase (short-subunit alcohol dehydrogenase family)
MSDALRYDGKRVVVSGGGGTGMGAATVELLTELGAEVHVLDLREPSTDVASFQQVDLRDADAIRTAVARIDGTIHSLCNCAGVLGAPLFPDVDTMLINFAAARLLAELCAERMTDGGAICNIASAAGSGWMMNMGKWLPVIGMDHDELAAWFGSHPEEIKGGYVPSKEALISWTMRTAVDYGERGIRLNCTSPGTTKTPMGDQFDQMPASEFGDVFTGGMGRRAEPREQAWPVVFLNSDAASFVNGANLATDGGAIAGLTTGRIQVDFSSLA